ncbi:NhaP-type Na+/H+ or K+/H+ antiporter [Parasphingorhabdus marina DSM 22363]|uniref:NhaP-type Na+/H+ or K+/H+ antiporter n=1 Tax=Parasphingorhabdus marina DSM 22363 TaxID=1123272 RepID=A0A1N6CNI8_9SPHN|nr:sodium:proton antiporter [Parasphingorhabdus marina]SIN60113.1 NhaP-type Na+/H+ or K+/H+ antiporter [Parasphingorhabdus marina DSM 22363]
MEIVDSLMVKIALIGLLGIGAQWVAWRTGRPAIALMLIVGIIAGPVLGIIDPERDFGALQEPIIKLAVAVILFEGGLSLNFRELRQAGGAVTMMVLIAGPIAWILGTAAAHYGAGLSWEISALLGGIMIVTGPTVIGPMLRTLRVPARVRNILKWEGIVNDPIGALLAVGIYAYITYEGPDANIAVISMDVLAASFIAGLLGAALGFAITWLFPRGHVPEYLKAPFLLITVIAGFVIADLIKHETGLITVTVMGVVMANRHIYSSQALHRFKEDLAVLLISGVFIILSATLDWETVQQFQFRFIVFLILLLFLVRPISVLVALLFTSVPWRERLFIAWIAPRGIVAVAITGLFALRLTEYGMPGAEALVPLSFAVVIATIFAHGFSAAWVAEKLGIAEGKGEGVLIVGATRWSVALGKLLKKMDVDVMIADTSRFALRRAKQEELRIHQGDILDEAHNDNVDLGEFQHLIVATDDDSHNQLITADLGPEMGFDQITRLSNDSRGKSKVGYGRILFESGADFTSLLDRERAGWRFSKTNITPVFSEEEYRRNLGEGEEPLAVLKEDGRLLFFATEARPVIETGDVVISFVAPDTPEERKAEREAKDLEKGLE